MHKIVAAVLAAFFGVVGVAAAQTYPS